MEQDIFKIYGSGEVGLKAGDLIKYSKLLTDVGFVIPNGIVIATDIYDEFMRLSLIRLLDEIQGEPEINDEFSKEVLLNFVDRQECPDFIIPINESILAGLETGRPYAIRSSSVSENGGTGIFKTEFFWPTGDKLADLHNLWLCEQSVYASESSADAKAWREKNKFYDSRMAILIMPIIGFHYEEFFFTPLSGTAYTSYRGLPTVRVVAGLGTKAVSGEGLVFHSQADVCDLTLGLWKQEMADAIAYDEIKKIYFRHPDILDEISPLTFNKIFEQLEELHKKGNFYLEWVIYKDQIYIVQCAEVEDRLPGNYDFDSEDYLLFIESNDVANPGRASCQTLVHVPDWKKDTQESLKQLNEKIKDFLLIISPYALSELTEIRHKGSKLNFSHFSNALAVIEEKGVCTIPGIVLHSRKGDGAFHFIQLCDRTNILFISAEFDTNYLENIKPEIFGRCIEIYQIESEILVGKEGYVYLKK